MKPDAERTDDVEHVAPFKGRQPFGAPSDALVEKFDAVAGAVDAIDALRPSQPQLARIGGRAQEIEELARLDGERLRGCRYDEMLVHVIHPNVRDHRAQGFLGRNIGLGRGWLALADDEWRRRKDLTHCTRPCLTCSKP